jgi:quercetin dioxygenase-like cupin family protein
MTSRALIIRHEDQAAAEKSTCGRRFRLISREDAAGGVAAWAHVVEMDGSNAHYHGRGTELYYVLQGEGTILLDGVAHAVRKGTMVHVPPGITHGTTGRMRVLVVGIPDISDDDLFFQDDPTAPRA